MPLIVYIINVDWYFRLHWLDRVLKVKENGFDVAVIMGLSSGGQLSDLEELGIRCKQLPISRNGTNLLDEFRLLQSIYIILKELNPTLVHNITIKPNLYGGVGARLLGVPAVSSITGLGTLFSSRGLRTWLLRSMVLFVYRWINKRLVNRVLFENLGDLHLFIRARVLLEKQAVKIQGAGVDPSLYCPSIEPPSSSGFRILWAARLLREKGLHQLVTAIESLQMEGIKVTALVAGILDEEAANPISIDEIYRWQSAGFIQWLGRRNDIQDVIRECHVVCLPTTYGEGIPRILIEGAACGRPLVATDLTGCNEIIDDGVNGFLIKPDRSLKDCLSALISDAGLRRRMGSAGRLKVLSGYSQEAVVTTMVSCYKEMLGST